MSVLYDTLVTAVEARCQYRVWIRFVDGTEGEVDLSDELDGETWDGELEQWRDPAFFSTVRIGGLGIAWGGEDEYEDEYDAISLPSDRLYADLRSLTSVDMYPELHAVQVVGARPLEKYRVWIRFADGTEGEADLGDFAGLEIFGQWDDPGVWEGMRIAYHTLEWGSEDPTRVLDICPEALYSRVAGVSREEMESAEFALGALERLAG